MIRRWPLTCLGLALVVLTSQATAVMGQQTRNLVVAIPSDFTVAEDSLAHTFMEEHPDVSLQFIVANAEDVLAMAAVGDPPDVAVVEPPLAAELFEASLLCALDDVEPPRVLRRVCYLSPATITGSSCLS